MAEQWAKEAGRIQDGCTPCVPTGQCCGRSLRLTLMVACLFVSFISFMSIAFVASDDGKLTKYDNFAMDELAGSRGFLVAAWLLVALTSLTGWYGVMTFNLRLLKPFWMLCMAVLFSLLVIGLATIGATGTACDHAYDQMCGASAASKHESCPPNGKSDEDAWKHECVSWVRWTTVGLTLVQAIFGWWFIHALWSYCKLVDVGVINENDPNGVWWGMSKDMESSDNHVHDDHFYDEPPKDAAK